MLLKHMLYNHSFYVTSLHLNFFKKEKSGIKCNNRPQRQVSYILSKHQALCTLPDMCELS